MGLELHTLGDLVQILLADISNSFVITFIGVYVFVMMTASCN